MILDFPFTGQVAMTSGDFDDALHLMSPHLKGHPPTGIEEDCRADFRSQIKNPRETFKNGGLDGLGIRYGYQF